MNSIHIKSQGPQIAAAYSRKMAGWLDDFAHPLNSGRLNRARRRARAGIAAP
jgi:hypothetical protein